MLARATKKAVNLGKAFLVPFLDLVFDLTLGLTVFLAVVDLGEVVFLACDLRVLVCFLGFFFDMGTIVACTWGGGNLYSMDLRIVL